MSTTKFCTKTVTASDVEKLKNATGISSELQQWIKSNGSSWAKARRQWGNVIEDANCPLSPAAATKKIMAYLG